MPFQPWLDDEEMGPETVESYLDNPTPKNPTAPKEMDPKVRQYMMDKYFQAADRSGVDAAKGNSKALGWGAIGVEALSKATQGDSTPQVFKKGWNETGRPQMTEVYESEVSGDPMRKAGVQGVKEAEADRQSKIQDFEMGNKLETQARNEAIQDEKLGMERDTHGIRMEADKFKLGRAEADATQEDARRDPNSDASKGFRALIGKVSPSLAPSLEGMSLADAERVVPGLVNSYEARLARQQQAGMAAQTKEAATAAKAQERGDRNGTDLRKEYASSPVFKNSQDLEQARSRAIKAAATKSPTGDIALIFSAMKMNDPGSTVRESEFAMMAKSGNWGQQVKALVEKAETGGLTDDKRKEIMSTIDTLYAGQMEELDRHDAYYSELASKQGVPVDQVIRPRTKVSPTPQKILAPEDQAAIDWAKANPNDPRSAQILKLHE